MKSMCEKFVFHYKFADAIPVRWALAYSQSSAAKVTARIPLTDELPGCRRRAKQRDVVTDAQSGRRLVAVERRQCSSASVCAVWFVAGNQVARLVYC
ncbi:uncharacterized protein LY79DRAFT_548036, partial [Colletotrichum navitas]